MKDRYELFESSQDMLVCELDKITKEKSLTPSSLDYLDKIVDIIKDLDEIMDNEDARSEDSYSQRSGRYYRGNSYRSMGNYRRGSSYRDTPADYDSTYSRGSKKDEMLDHLYMAYDSASTEEERKRVKRMIDELESGK